MLLFAEIYDCLKNINSEIQGMIEEIHKICKDPPMFAKIHKSL